MRDIYLTKDKSTIEIDLEDASSLDDLNELDCLEIEIQVNGEKYTVVDGSKFGGKSKKPIEVRDKDGHIHMYRVLSSDKNNEPYKILKDNPIDGVPHVENLQELKGETLIIEEKIDGLNLEEYYNIHRTLSEEKAWNFILQLCDILTELHHYDIIHNDIKRTNIMVDKNDKVWLIDFDSSKIVDRTKNPDKDIDTTQSVSPGYATLEQMNGVVIEPTDIALIGYTFTKVLGNDSYNGIYKAILNKCTQHDFKLRYQSAAELKEALLTKKKTKEDIWSYVDWCNFRGRIDRTNFIIRIMLFIVTVNVIGIIFDHFEFLEIPTKIFCLTFYASTISKRLHDINLTGYLCIPIVILTLLEVFVRLYLVDLLALLVHGGLVFYRKSSLPNKYGDTL